MSLRYREPKEDFKTRLVITRPLHEMLMLPRPLTSNLGKDAKGKVAAQKMAALNADK